MLPFAIRLCVVVAAASPAIPLLLSGQESRSTRAAPTTLAITNVTLVDGLDTTRREHVTVLISGSRIVAIGPTRSTSVPRSARRIDGRGLFAVPGLWDMHVHLVHRNELALLLAAGVTSVRDMGSEISTVGPWRDSIEAGTLIGPRIRTSGPVLESPSSIADMLVAQRRLGDSSNIAAWRISVPTPESAAHAVDSVAALGADFIKARTYASTATYFAIAAAARRRGMRFVGHPPFGLSIDEVAVADSGQHSLEHGFFPDRVDTLPPARLQQIADAYQRGGTVLVPTLTAWEWRTIPYDTFAHQSVATQCPGLPADVQREVARRWAEFLYYRRPNPTGAPESAQTLAVWRRVLDRHFRDLALLRARGVRILPGTDVPAFVCPDIALNTELELFVRALGMTPREALRSATLDPAIFFGLQDSLGTIEVGKIADIVLLDADPMADIRNLRRVRAVIAAGRMRMVRR